MAMSNVVLSGLRTPRSVNWNIELDRELMHDLFVRAGYRERENRFESIVDQVALASGATATALRTDGSSRYREAQITARYTVRGTDQIVGSYTRASAFGSLNDFNGFFGNIENPVIRPDAQGPLPWDAPSRVLLWSSISLPRGFAVFPVLDTRSGFPLSNIDGDRNFVGLRNQAGRYPTFVSLDTQITKKLRVFHDRIEDLQHHRSLQPSRLPGRPGEPRVRGLQQQRRPHVSRQVGLRVLNASSRAARHLVRTCNSS
jgi:hypothetical protein